MLSTLNQVNFLGFANRAKKVLQSRRDLFFPVSLCETGCVGSIVMKSAHGVHSVQSQERIPGVYDPPDTPKDPSGRLVKSLIRKIFVNTHSIRYTDSIGKPVAIVPRHVVGDVGNAEDKCPLQKPELTLLDVKIMQQFGPEVERFLSAGTVMEASIV
jgi:hypothetical protein